MAFAIMGNLPLQKWGIPFCNFEDWNYAINTGLLARCGIAALQDENISRLADDHRNALTFARGLNKITGYTVEEEKVHTNIVFVYYDFSEAVLLDIIAACKEHGVLCNQPRNGVWRFAFCREVTDEDVETALHVIRLETSARV